MSTAEKEIKHVDAPSGVPMSRAPTEIELAGRQNGGDVLPDVMPPPRLVTSKTGTPADKAPDPSLSFAPVPKERYTDPKYVDLGEVLNQDAYNLPHVQAGMNSDAFEGLILCAQEVRIVAFHKAWADYVEPGTAR